MLFSSQTLFMLHQKVWSSQIQTLHVRSTRSPRFVLDLNFQNFFMSLGQTDSSISVLPRSLSWSEFSISVQPIWTFRSHRFSVTVHSYASRCHRVVPLGHTDRVRLYIVTGKILEISPKPFARAIARSAIEDLRIVSSSPAAPCSWSPPPSTDFAPAVATVTSSSPS